MRVITCDEMRAIDGDAISTGGISGIELMENAGNRAAVVAQEMLGWEGGWKVAVFAGRGNNGGDGLVLARLISQRGAEVTVYLLADPNSLSDDSAVNLRKLEDTNVRVVKLGDKGDLDEFHGEAEELDLVVDAVFGTGFRGAAEGLAAGVIEAMNSSGVPILSVDIPSGVNGDSGVVEGPVVRAKKTVTFVAPKVGLVQFPGAGYVGELEVVDIGIPQEIVEKNITSETFLMTEENADSWLPHRRPDVHKNECGRVLVIAGSPGMTGAAALTVRAALRSGAGLVTLAMPRSLHDIFEIKLTENITIPLPETDLGTLDIEAFPVIAELCERFDALAVGPGVTTERNTVQLVRQMVGRLDLPLVVDADGLNSLVGATDLITERRAETILTPHPGEMGRLAGISAAEVQKDRIGVASRYATEWGAVIVLKGAGTIIAEPGGQVMINTSGNPGMATAGMGDVLTGCITSLLAQGLGVLQAAAVGCYVHGSAADLVAQLDGEIGMTAGDVARHLPLVLRRVE